MTATVNIRECLCDDGHKIAIAELDNPTSLNALTYDMLAQLNEALTHWQHDDDIACVLIHGVGDKAFCAGGDVRAMYRILDKAQTSSAASPSSSVQGDTVTTMGYLTDYFTLEYRTDYLIHTYPKPVIVWGGGIVMGGGIGLYIGASHRVTTPSSRLAMPEISIGLYPDVGATWFLNHLPQGIGLFLGLTGVAVNATDALALAMTEHILLPEHKSRLLERLIQAHWEDNDPDIIVTQLLDSFGHLATDSHPPSQLLPHLAAIQTACQYGSLDEICQHIEQLPPVKGANAVNDVNSNQWLEQAKTTLREGSPISAHICYRQFTQFHNESLADCFRLELALSVRSSELGEFHEGVRARLIEKTGQPNWLYSDVSSVDSGVIEQLFTPLWADNEHPLQHLK
ncbi:enoyl-CoA hydratase/isomerase family protein [Photobacterium nomapromontoriensis]|uniref:enoyl-CoA hydratase/isomerase family protein n=1 Tax=Photobacterium nomapromontoriensis TaxID=2910237 RepID=UPI003D0C80E5